MRLIAGAVVLLSVLAGVAPPSSAAPADPIASLSLEQRAGLLFMVGTDAEHASAKALALVRDRSVGGVFLGGRSTRGVQRTAKVVAAFTALNPALLVSTDQEGGQVQVLQGTGFSTMPTALEQGTIPPARLERKATRWGAQLASTGVNLDLGPVVDIVSGPASKNAPIAAFDREYGYDADTIVAHAGAVADGLRSSGVTPTLKHFPGLGHVRHNTDTTADVHDHRTAADSDSVDVYRRLLAEGPAVVMVSSAIYDRIDPTQPAVFSSAVVTDLLRTQLGFTGVVMTDDVSTGVAVQDRSPGARAVDAIAAGCDIVLVSHRPRMANEMIDAVIARAQSDPAFAARVDDAARHVLALRG